ncbi:putative receptor-like protein kinase At1g80870 [Curcuma longa]|uniref:putative receptor-like protein kinase At1g80870 n=1 Tax=Curcuma longa TaxID=136217 RepID=UPI003D9E30EE
MPSRRLSSSASAAASAHHHHLILLASATAVSFVLLIFLALLLFLLYFYLSHRRPPTLPLSSPSPSPSPRLRRFSYRCLRSATASFDPSRSLGRGASAAVFRGVLPDGKSVAIKRLLLPLSSSSDREFHNELHVLAGIRPSPFVVSLLGYCLEGSHRRRRRLLVYEYMPHGSLQEALFSSTSLLIWDRRFSIVLDVARALAFLHLECDPPVVHGDIKPSNVLLGFDFQAKISDFGLSRMKTEPDLGYDFFSQDLFQSRDLAQESPQVDFAHTFPSSSSIKLSSSNTPIRKDATAATTSFPVQDETFSFEHSKELSASVDDLRTESADQWDNHWWWKQDGSRELSSKDYVTEWIGSQICTSGNPSDKCFDFRNSSRVEVGDDALFTGAHTEKKHEKKKCVLHSDRKMREWWKEEYFAEISRKGHGKKDRQRWFRTISSLGEEYANRSRDLNADVSFRKGCRKKRSRSAGSEMFSCDLLSKELSSTTSIRGTVCYVAPECHGGDQLMEKADVYSFGVLMLVIVSGRRPLHVLPSPVKLEKANLVSWCRQLAQAGNLFDLVDERLKGAYDKDQASLCINLALLCLQRIPELRPDSGDIVKILTGEMELPVVPCEFSPSPPTAKHYIKSRRKASADAD